MECNKEEAIRAKEIAESKMQNKDYVGAHKFALKAQKLFPNLDNILQILAVCEVFCAAEKNILGKEMDWYGILNVEQTADEQLIKKQFKKLALRLHPDKNNFAGAEAAFKIIGEAQQVLLDRGKRSLHDMKRRAFVRPTPTVPSRASQPEASKKLNVMNPPTVRTNPSSSSSPYKNKNTQGPEPHQQTRSQSSNARASFWTSCPFCGMKYQFFIETLEKSLICHSCNRPFIAHDINSKVVQPETMESQPVVPEKKEFPDQGTGKVAHESNVGNNISNKNFHGNCNGGHSTKVDKEAGSFEFRQSKKNGTNRRKQVEESSDDCDTGSSSSTDTVDVFDNDGNFEPKVFSGFNVEETRRSTRTKRQVSYEEKLSDNVEFASPRKKSKRSKTSCATNEQSRDEMLKEVREDEKEAREDTKDMIEDEHEKCFVVDDHLTSTSSSKEPEEQEIYEFPDPEFSDFDNIRKKGCFKVGQMWAIYDTTDAMPRFYALIKKVFPTGFKVRITWLEPDPDDEDQIKWVNGELPFSCGKFITGGTQNTEDIGTFSHIMEPDIGKNRGSYKIYPRKGETWAIFKNWGMEWLTNSDNNRKFDFNFVEILSDYIEGDGIFVAYLGKVKNFVSIFCRIIKEEIESFKIPHNELCRFSHKVPSFQMTGEEREDVPKGSFELDPASLPTNLEDEVKPMTGSNVGSSTYQTNETEIHFDSINHNSEYVIKSDNSDKIEFPKPDFFDFAAEKSTEKLQVGQIWALYSGYDGLPKLYGKLKKIESCPNTKLHISWLLSIKEQNNMLRWVDKKMPICCGKFKISTSKPEYYYDTEEFSHQLRAEITDKSKGHEISIFPRIGEIWALYKNWDVKMKCSELEKCEYHIGEVIEVNDLRMKVVFLERVNGFKLVFKRQVKEGFAVYKDIPRSELLRFSHQIPAFQLKEERGGSLKGSWELDPASVPVLLYCSD